MVLEVVGTYIDSVKPLDIERRTVFGIRAEALAVQRRYRMIARCRCWRRHGCSRLCLFIALVIRCRGRSPAARPRVDRVDGRAQVRLLGLFVASSWRHLPRAKGQPCDLRSTVTASKLGWRPKPLEQRARLAGQLQVRERSPAPDARAGRQRGTGYCCLMRLLPGGDRVQQAGDERAEESGCITMRRAGARWCLSESGRVGV